MTRIIYLVTILLSFSCQPDKNQTTDNGKSRIELVNDRPYRNLELNDKLRTSVNELIYQILKQSETLDTLRLYYLSDKGEIMKVDKTWTATQYLINDSYEIWRTNDISATIAIYPGFSQNATTREQKKIYVIEVEHKELTGTCRMFFDDPNQRELTELNYSDRN
jgi:hypothetical protein